MTVMYILCMHVSYLYVYMCVCTLVACVYVPIIHASSYIYIFHIMDVTCCSPAFIAAQNVCMHLLTIPTMWVHASMPVVYV